MSMMKPRKCPTPWRLGKETKGGNVWVLDARGSTVTLEKMWLAERIVAAINAHEANP